MLGVSATFQKLFKSSDYFESPFSVPWINRVFDSRSRNRHATIEMPQQSESFKRAIARFEKDVGPTRAQEFSNSSLHDVHLLMKQIQAEQEKRGELRYLKRIESFLEAMKELGKVIEVFTNTTVFLCYVWVSIVHSIHMPRFPLTSTGTHQIPAWCEYLSPCLFF